MNLKQNLSWNIAGNVIPVIAAIYCVPRLISNIGEENFGILLVVLIVIGYAGILDLGLGRALTKSISECLKSNRKSEIYTISWTGLIVLGCLGCAVSLLTLLIVIAHSYGWLLLPRPLNKNALEVIYLLIICLPMVFITSGIRSLLEAIHRFDLVNKIRIPVGISNYFVPLLISYFCTSLTPIVLGLTLTRFITTLIYYFVWKSTYSHDCKCRKFDRAQLNSLIKFGGWVSVSNIIGPLILYADRFIISGIVSSKNFAYYATPYELSTKVWLIPTAYAGVLFPLFAQNFYGGGARKTYIKSLIIVFLMMLPICIILYFFSFNILKWWISENFAKNSHKVLSTLALGIFVNSLAQIPFTYIQAIGKPMITAKIHLISLLPYLLLLWMTTQSYGIIGAATSWSVRILITSLVLFLISEKSFSKLTSSQKNI